MNRRTAACGTAIERHLSRAARLIECAQRFVDPFGGRLERAEVHADAVGRFEIEVRLHCLHWIHVNGLHEPARLVGTDGEHPEIELSLPSLGIGVERRRCTRPGR